MPASTPDAQPRTGDAELSELMALALDVADVLLSMGLAASDVVTMTLDVLHRYSDQRFHVDVLSTVVMLSVEPSPGVEAVTVMRPVHPRVLDNTVIQQTEELVRQIRSTRLTAPAARSRLVGILAASPGYPVWHRIVAGGLVSAGVPLLFRGSALIVALTFVVGCLAVWVIQWCARKRMPNFFIQMVTAAVVTVASAAITAGVGALPGQSRPLTTLVVVGGIVMLVVGLVFVGAFQDAIDEFYLTAAARVFKVVMMTAGIIPGILIGIRLTEALGLGMVVPDDNFPIGALGPTTVGAAVIAAAYAWYCQSRPTAIAAAGIVGAVVWWLFLGLYVADFGEIPASAAAALLAGLMGVLVARRWKVPGIAVTTAGIVTLVPGLRLFSGLMQVVGNSAPYSPGWSTLLGAMGIAFAIAAGASAGNVIGRPLRQRLVLARNMSSRSLRRRVRTRTGQPGSAGRSGVG